ncbi:MAG: hypothetical protein ABIH35_01575 [Patescibacteria group bacterium]
MTKKTQKRLAAKRAHDDSVFSEAEDFLQQEDTEGAIQALEKAADKNRLLGFLEKWRTAEELTAKQALLILETRNEIIRLPEAGFLRRQASELVAESLKLRQERHPILAGRIEKLLKNVFGSYTADGLIEEAGQ